MNSDFMNFIINSNKKTKNIVGESFSVDDRDYFKKVYDYLKSNNYDTSRLEERLKTLTMIKGDEKRDGLGSHYSERKNELTYTDEKDLYHETFHIATKGIVIGPLDKQIGKGLNEGITDMLAKRVNPNVTTHYKVESLIAEVFEKAFGPKVFDSYFKGSGKEFIQQFDSDLMLETLADLDDYSDAMSNFWDDGNNMEQGEQIITLEKRSSYIRDLFDNVMYDLSDLLEAKEPKEKEEIVSFIESKLASKELETVTEILEYKQEKIDLKEIFNIKDMGKRY